MGKKSFVEAVKSKKTEIIKTIEREVPDVSKEVKDDLVKKVEQAQISTSDNKGVNKGSNSSAFKYEHNPSENPKVLKDAYEDSEAVYGYRPREDGSLSAFADADWSDPEFVEYARQNRVDYHNRNEAGTMELVTDLRKEGCNEGQIVRAVCEIYVNYKGYNIIFAMEVWGFGVECHEWNIKEKIKGDAIKSPAQIYFVVDKTYESAFIDLIYFFLNENNADGMIREECKILNW